MPKRSGTLVVDQDVGVLATTRESLAGLPRREPDGVVTFGSQTHPADGAAGISVKLKRRAILVP